MCTFTIGNNTEKRRQKLKSLSGSKSRGARISFEPVIVVVEAHISSLSQPASTYVFGVIEQKASAEQCVGYRTKERNNAHPPNEARAISIFAK